MESIDPKFKISSNIKHKAAYTTSIPNNLSFFDSNNEISVNNKSYSLVINSKFPQTRYQGSKLKLLPWYFTFFQHLEFKTVLDAFAGTGAVSYLFKKMKKQVTYNDYLKFNAIIGTSLIENNSQTFKESNISSIFEQDKNFNYKTLIQDNFRDIYYTDEENHLLDIIVQNIYQLYNKYEQSLAFFALFQACIQKRPFNLFHRKNLYVRLNNVHRSFGNKKTWDTPFIDLFTRAIKEANNAVFDNKNINSALNYQVTEIPIPAEGFDLVYLDPPYISLKSVGVDYRDFYHFLEGISHYNEWETYIDQKSKHKRLKVVPNDWTNSKKIIYAFEKVIHRYQDSKIIISYRSPGIPSVKDLVDLLSSYKTTIICKEKEYKYVLTSTSSKVHEVLIIAE